MDGSLSQQVFRSNPLAQARKARSERGGKSFTSFEGQKFTDIARLTQAVSNQSSEEQERRNERMGSAIGVQR